MANYKGTYRRVVRDSRDVREVYEIRTDRWSGNVSLFIRSPYGVMMAPMDFDAFQQLVFQFNETAKEIDASKMEEML